MNLRTVTSGHQIHSLCHREADQSVTKVSKDASIVPFRFERVDHRLKLVSDRSPKFGWKFPLAVSQRAALPQIDREVAASAVAVQEEVEHSKCRGSDAKNLCQFP